MYITDVARERGKSVYLHIFCVRLLHVCSFHYSGQFQSLRLWERADGTALTHLVYSKSVSPRGEPKGRKTYVILNLIMFNLLNYYGL